MLLGRDGQVCSNDMSAFLYPVLLVIFYYSPSFFPSVSFIPFWSPSSLTRCVAIAPCCLSPVVFPYPSSFPLFSFSLLSP